MRRASYETMFYEQTKDEVAVIRLNRPDRLNALSTVVREGMGEAFTEFDASDSLEVAILTGTGRSFCAGEDMKEALEQGEPGLSKQKINDPFNDRTGLVGLSEASRTGAATTASLSTSGTTTTGTGGTGTSTANSNGTASAPAEPQLTASEATKQRYAVWLDRAVMGDVPLDPRIFAIDDLMPVGLVDGGKGAQEVMFY